MLFAGFHAYLRPIEVARLAPSDVHVASATSIVLRIRTPKTGQQSGLEEFVTIDDFIVVKLILFLKSWTLSSVGGGSAYTFVWV